MEATSATASRAAEDFAQDSGTGKSKSLRAPLILSCLFVLLYSVNFRTTLTGDSQAHLYQAASLRWSGDFTLDEYRDRIIAGNGGTLPYFVTESQGHLRSVFNFLPAMLLLPFFTLASWMGGAEFQSDMGAWGLSGKFTASLMILCAGWVLWWILRHRVREPVIALALIAYWFGTPLWPASIDFMQSQPLQLFKLAALAAIFGAREGSRPGFFVAGLLLGLSVLCRYQTLPSAAVVALTVIVLNLRDRSIAFFIIGGIVPALLGAAYHWIAFGCPFSKGPSLYQAFDAPMLLTAGKLLINPNKGMLAHSPWAVFAIMSAILGLIRLVRRRGRADEHRQVILVCAASAIPTVMLYSKTNGWAGGWCWGYRYLTDILPEAILIFVLVANQCMRVRWSRIAVCASVAISFCFQSIGALAYDNQWHAVYDSGFLREGWLWQVRDGEIAFYAKRGRVYLGNQSIEVFENPYARKGFGPVEVVKGRRAVWTEGKASFLKVASQHPATIRFFPSVPSVGEDTLRVRIRGPHIHSRELDLIPGKWQTVELPEIPFLLGAIVEIEVIGEQEPTTDSVKRGVAIPLKDINYPE